MINDIDAIRRRSTPSRKNAEHDVFGSPCGLSVAVEAHIFDSNGNKEVTSSLYNPLLCYM